MSEPLKSKLDEELSGLVVDDALRGRILGAAAKKPVIRLAAPARKKPRKALIGIVAALLCLVLSVPVLGSTVPEYNSFISMISPALAAYLMPATGTASDNGITVELQSAIADQSSLYVVFTVKDTEQNRLSATTGLGDHAAGNGQFVGSYETDYNALTKTLTVHLYTVGFGTIAPGEQTELAFFSFMDDKYNEAIAEGEWRLRFSPAMLETKSYKTNAVLPELTIGQVDLSPISLRFVTSEKRQMIVQTDVLITMKNGDHYYYSAGRGPEQYYDEAVIENSKSPSVNFMISNVFDKNAATIILSFGTFIELGEIESIALNGVDLGLA